MCSMRIATVGLSEWELNFVTTTVGIASGVEIGPWRNEADPHKADVILANADVREGAKWLASAAHSAPDMPVVVALYENPQGDVAMPALIRPVGHASLIALLRRLEAMLREKRMHSRPQVAATPADRSFAAAELRVPVLAAPSVVSTAPVVQSSVVDMRLARKGRRSARFFENSRLLGILQQARRAEQPVEVSHPLHGVIGIYPHRGIYCAAVDPCDRADLFRVPAHELVLRSMVRNGIEPAHSRNPSRALTRLLYCAAIYGSEGRLLPECEPEDVLELCGVPDLDGLPPTAEQKAVLQALVAGPGTLRQIAKRSGSQMDCTIDTLNGFEVLSCLRRVRDGVVVPSPAPMVIPPDTAGGTGGFRRLRAFFHSIMSGPSADH